MLCFDRLPSASDRPDFTDARRDEDAPDRIEEQAVAGAFNYPDPRQPYADPDPQQGLTPRFGNSDEGHIA